jgi:antirestriction protein
MEIPPKPGAGPEATGNDYHEDARDTAREEAKQPKLQPRIYVASLSDYNAGRLHGVWLDANQDAEDLQAIVDAMLQRSPEPIAEEFAVHDYEEWGPVHLDEYTSLDTISRVARGLAAHGAAFGHWADYVRFGEDDLDRFEEAYQGCWESLAAWAEDIVDDLGANTLEAIPEWLQPYVTMDFEQLGSDMAMDYYTSEDDEGVHIYATR